MYYGDHLAQLNFRTGTNYDKTTRERIRLVTQFRRWMRMQGCYLCFARWVHTDIYSVTHRGFIDPGLRVNHGRLRGVITRIPPAVHEMIN